MRENKDRHHLIVTDGKQTEYIHGAGQTLAHIVNDTDVTYLHNDHLGTPFMGTDASGNELWREQYTPFGEKYISHAANDDLGGYTGHIYDSATGLNYMQARYHDPVIGRFLSIDPVGFRASNPVSFNRYAYASNNPVNRIDPTGMTDEPDDSAKQEQQDASDKDMEEMIVTADGSNAASQARDRREAALKATWAEYQKFKESQQCMGDCHGFDGETEGPLPAALAAILNDLGTMVVTAPVAGGAVVSGLKGLTMSNKAKKALCLGASACALSTTPAGKIIIKSSSQIVNDVRRVERINSKSKLQDISDLGAP